MCVCVCVCVNIIHVVILRPGLCRHVVAYINRSISTSFEGEMKYETPIRHNNMEQLNK